ncbi:MAG: AAA family ATPase [Rhodobacteraceae bacterium]|jgi:RecA-family ATPase|nr:AAA family ATPase [Paracoccaceae bacterium]MCZ8082988.1 AAA family ATPase [Paracoccaceae bacterium]
MIIPQPVPFVSAQQGALDDASLAFFSAASLNEKPVPERLWLVMNLIPAKTVTILTGDGGIGKSLAALQLATATALGRSWLAQATTPGSALFISAEDDRDELHRRVASLASAERFTMSDLDGLTLCSLAGEDALLSTPDGPGRTMKETVLFQRLEEWIAEHRPTLTVLDTLADLFGGDEINRAQARQFIGQLRRLALKHETTVLLLAHPSLSGMTRGDGNSGSTAWNNSVRSRLYLRRSQAEDDAAKDPNARILEVVKSNYGPVGASLPLLYRDGAFFCDGDGDARNILAANAKQDRVFMKLLHICNENGRRVNPYAGNNYAPKVFGAHPDGTRLGDRTGTRPSRRAALPPHTISCSGGGVIALQLPIISP